MKVKRALANTLALRIKAENDLKKLVNKKADKAKILLQLNKIQLLEEKEKKILEAVNQSSFLSGFEATADYDASLN